ncbi:LmbE family protein [Blastopirellula marina]|uniref:LmbE family protein n=1 Tax=Blastopirellula marina TaxID=124 RepID=A0A2S8F017_9BACT|nr:MULTISPECIES: PIG-L family deacetylase [Pirellulaceae]PQO25505.1 LmbE family protein [Blastopirellula marina]RCS42469.1 LmbE family protein [Bremerella cremea]
MTVDVEKEYPQIDILAVGAHPDDVEIACGGTLAKLADLGHTVGVIDLTDGEPTPRSPDPETRLAEAAAAAKVLGVQKRITLDLPNRKLFDSFEARVALAKEFRKYRPKVVIGFGDRTPMASPDHWQAMQITDAAVFYSRLTKWDETFDHLPVHTIGRQLYYKIAFEPIHKLDAPGSFVHDITDCLERKLESIRCYQTQFSEEKAYVFERVKGAAIYLGATAGYGAGELFYTTRAVGTPDMMQLLYPDDRVYTERYLRKTTNVE